MSLKRIMAGVLYLCAWCSAVLVLLALIVNLCATKDEITFLQYSSGHGVDGPYRVANTLERINRKSLFNIIVLRETEHYFDGTSRITRDLLPDWVLLTGLTLVAGLAVMVLLTGSHLQYHQACQRPSNRLP